MTNTKKSPYKEKRSWDELVVDKKAYIKRKQEEDDANKEIFKYRPVPFRLRIKDDSSDEI